MERPLAGRIILIIEDEPLIALDIRETFEDAGARVILARTVAAALVAIQEPGLSAAIIDHALGDGDSSEICERLNRMNVPFIMHSGFAHLNGACADAGHVLKPATPTVLVATVAGLVASQPISNSGAVPEHA
jgi:DNA-binding response OmpR family regulator